MAKLPYILFALCGGMLVSVQAALNSLLRIELKSPFLSALISFSVGAFFLVALVLASRFSLTELRAAFVALSRAPFWLLLGGVCGVGYVYSAILGVPKIGAAMLVACLVLGQQLGAMVLDHYGWLGMAQISFNWKRGAGMLLIVGGVMLLQSRQ